MVQIDFTEFNSICDEVRKEVNDYVRDVVNKYGHGLYLTIGAFSDESLYLHGTLEPDYADINGGINYSEIYEISSFGIDDVTNCVYISTDKGVFTIEDLTINDVINCYKYLEDIDETINK